jgi:cytochrome b561
MSKDGSPHVTPVEDALAGTPEPWERWETSLVLISLGLGLFALLLLGWLVDRFILS